MTDHLTDGGLDAQVDAIKRWLRSDRGRRAVQRASERAKRSAKRRREARQVDPVELLRRDVGMGQGGR